MALLMYCYCILFILFCLYCIVLVLVCWLHLTTVHLCVVNFVSVIFLQHMVCQYFMSLFLTTLLFDSVIFWHCNFVGHAYLMSLLYIVICQHHCLLFWQCYYCWM